MRGARANFGAHNSCECANDLSLQKVQQVINVGRRDFSGVDVALLVLTLRDCNVGGLTVSHETGRHSLI